MTSTSVPFLKDVLINWGWLYIPLVILVVTGASNAVNLADGLDGLAIGLSALAFAGFAVIAYLSGHSVFADYLNLLYLPEVGELTVYCAAVVGAGIGFLWFNAHPARIFMGDTGSLALGGALGTVAIMVKKEFLLVVIGGHVRGRSAVGDAAGDLVPPHRRQAPVPDGAPASSFRTVRVVRDPGRGPVLDHRHPAAACWGCRPSSSSRGQAMADLR